MRASPEIYLDTNAAAPLKPEVRLALTQALEATSYSFNLSKLSNSMGRSGGETLLLPNASSTHSFGRLSKKTTIQAREKVARSLGSQVQPEEVYFTSSGTEAIQMAIRSALEPSFLKGDKVHWITTPVEHDATFSMVQWVKERGGDTDFLPVDALGRPRVGDLSKLVRPETKLVSTIWVNNETGVITDVGALGAEAENLNLPLHLDAAQAWGKIPLNLTETAAHWVSFSGQKIGALSGTGVLWKSPSAKLLPLILGKQENLTRGGTENLLGILSLGSAASGLNDSEVQSWSERVQRSRDRLETQVSQTITRLKINGQGAPRVSNTSNFSFEGVEKPGLVAALDLMGYGVSSGSACSSGVAEPSRVLLAMGHSGSTAASSIRVSLYEELSEDVLNGFVQALAECVKKLRT